MSTPSLNALPIRRLTHRDLRACADLAEDRGWPRDEHKWGLLLTAGTGYGIDDPQGGLLSTSILTSYGPQEAPDLAAVGMMLVAGRHARQGVGRRMMRHLIDIAGGTPLTLHATDLGRPLYEEVGFKAVGQARVLRGHFVPDETSTLGTRPAVAEDLPAILRLDNAVFGTDRTHIITRLPAFADQLRVAESDGEITGYAAAWPTTDTHAIGPLVAHDLQTAKALITSLAAGTDRPLRTNTDTRHEKFVSWLEDRGLASRISGTLMAHGIPQLPGDWTRNFTPLNVATG
ncbi:GNAT family N-acetyltransferase [Streptomyces sp. TS71-3]|uniref:GNAT family N-acetyltransferase n=1 Tax=Streptomyces sp. TS71-3 TaxID=2733862 RepID=UPI001B2D745F|nr:GNAT family N-acetyltransferase [Streptomyces sp. TS71-3]GHJ40221.1 acetyltransferase [Streptomyces sp. TS71-3]